MSTATESVVKVSFGRCCVAPTFFDRFYEIFLNSHPAIKPMFQHTDMSRQKSLLRQGLTMLIMHGEGNRFGTQSLERIAESHSRKKLNISPDLYPYWMNSLLKVVKECDPEYTPALEAEWKKILKKGTEFLIDKY